MGLGLQVRFEEEEGDIKSWMKSKKAKDSIGSRVGFKEEEESNKLIGTRQLCS